MHGQQNIKILWRWHKRGSHFLDDAADDETRACIPKSSIKNGIKISILMWFFLQQNTSNGHKPAFNIKGGQSASKLDNFCVCCSFSVVGIWRLFPVLKQC